MNIHMGMLLLLLSLALEAALIATLAQTLTGTSVPSLIYRKIRTPVPNYHFFDVDRSIPGLK